jgi:hypothetical protein
MRRKNAIRMKEIISKNDLRPETLNKIEEFSLEKSFTEPILIWINTYNRPNELRSLLTDICDNKSNFDIKIFILDDCSKEDYTKMLQKFSGRLDITYHKMSYNYGKKLYWRMCNYVLNRIKLEGNQYKYFIKLDDDCRLISNFFLKCINIWKNINDNKKICLNFRLDTREGNPIWTGVVPRRYNFNGVTVYLSQWVDMDFFCEFSMFNALNFKITEQLSDRWKTKKESSSGVGRDISIRLNKTGYHLYLTTESLVQHDHHGSKMNPSERDKNPLITKPFTNFNYGMPKCLKK